MMAMKTYIKVLALLGVALLWPFSLNGGDRGAQNPDVQTVIDELNEITKRARETRSADPWLLSSLEDLVNRYAWPWRTELLLEEFKDGDYSRNPTWDVTNGRFWIDDTIGLRSRIIATPKKASKPKPAKKEEEDTGMAFLNTLLNDVLGTSEKEEEKEQAAETRVGEGAEVAKIVLPLAISNAFAMETSFSVHNAPSEKGRLEIEIYQKLSSKAGYRLSIHPGSDAVIDLLRTRSDRSSVIDSVALENSVNGGSIHVLELRRDENGKMLVFLDKKQIMDTSDRAITDSFNGISIVNHGGDYGIRSVVIYGVN
jgi:hypothetical protein